MILRLSPGQADSKNNMSFYFTGAKLNVFLNTRSIQGHVARAARGAVRSGPLRQADVLHRLQVRGPTPPAIT